MATRYIHFPTTLQFDVPGGWVQLDVGGECPHCPDRWVHALDTGARVYRCGNGHSPQVEHPFPEGVTYSAQPVMLLVPDDPTMAPHRARLYEAIPVDATFPVD